MKRIASSLQHFVTLIVCSTFLQGFHGAIDVHFENKEAGFFLKQSGSSRQQQQLQQWPTDLDGVPVNMDDNSLLSIERFTVFHNSHPISVRAVYGPFSTKQTVPARYIVPESLAPPPPYLLTVVVNSSASSEGTKVDPLVDGRHLEVSAHLVNHEIARDSPVLRVLFHMVGVDRAVRKYGKLQSVCVVLHISFNDQSPLVTTCSPSLDDGQCLAEVIIPSTWWPPLPGFDQKKPHKSPQRTVQASYYVLEPKIELQTYNSESLGTENCSPHLQIQPLTKIDNVPLVEAQVGYRELKIDDVLFTLVPMTPVYPRSKIYVPVYIRFQSKNNIVGFVIKARSKSGLKITDAHCRVPDYWNLSFTPNPKNMAATVTVMLKNAPNKIYNKTEDEIKMDERVDEVFSWLLEVEHDPSSDVWNEEAHVVWIVHYVVASNQEDSYLTDFADATAVPSGRKFLLKAQSSKRMERTKHKITARFEVQKDITQAVLPVSKTWELINTALLTGKQVSQPMKIFVVSQSGKIADVTRQSTCHTEDDSVLKVTSSCSSVYVDGSEMRGSSNATILVKYETFTGTASFVVWMPELAELDIVISDVKLSQIYDWVVPDTTPNRFSPTKRSSKSKSETKLTEDAEKKKWSNSKYARNMNLISADYAMESDKTNSNSVCKLKYQQATVDVYCRFKAVDHDTGRVSYLINRKTWLKITDLVMRGLRIADSQIATLNGRIITGRNVGRTEVQIVSSLSGRVLGYKEIRVVNDKVSITKLMVNVVSGLQLNIVPDSSGENICIAETSITRKLSAQYQEGLLDIEVEFSDGSSTSISDINVMDYAIAVDSLSPEVVAFAPMVTSIYPRVIAVGEGNGNLLKVSLLLPDSCRTEARLKDYVLISTSAFINVIFYDNDYGQRSPIFVQNDGGVVGAVSGLFSGNNKGDKKRNDMEQSADLQDFISGISTSNEVIKEPAVQADQHQSSKNYLTVHRRSTSHISPMEMGMYIILATFSFAIIVFVVSCIVYASKYKPQNIDYQNDCAETSSYLSNGYKLLSNSSGPTKREPPTTNVHDWVWLGRATLERASGLLVPSISVNDKLRRKNNNWIRITSNPTYAPEPSPDVDLISEKHNNGSATQCNVGRISEKKDKPRIDSTTYNKHNILELPRRNSRQRCFRLPTIPGRPNGLNENEDYKPPVPPHQNLDVAKTCRATNEIVPPNAMQSDMTNNGVQPESDVPHRRKHHHHHHHHHHHRKKSTDSACKNNNIGNTCVVTNDDAGSIKSKKENNENCPKFVNSSKKLSSGVRKANIVGNPMLSTEKKVKDSADDGCLGIEDLNLAMDYEQIMEYFDNLKESTA